MKKFLSIALVLIMLLGIFSISAFAEDVDDEKSATVYVNVSNAGSLVLAQGAVTVTDIDNDGLLTVNDALYCAHEAKYDGGAEAGYAYENSDWGLSLTKLWGVENGGGYGYYVNNNSAWSLADPVKDGDCVTAFVYTDLETWSDTYCFFDKNTASGTEGDTIDLTLSCAGYDEEYNPVVLPVEGATITIDGAATEFKTNAEGKVTVTLVKAGDVVISAISNTQTLVPPVCMVSVSEKEADTLPDDNTTEAPTSSPETEDPTEADSKKKGCGSTVGVGSVALIGAIAAMAFALKRKENE